MNIPYYKAHGAGNDFLFTFEAELEEEIDEAEQPAVARAICHRHEGVGADGWYVIDGSRQTPAIHLFNSDGSSAELSGNGTRCAAAILVERGEAGPDVVHIETGAGPRTLRLTARKGMLYEFEMEMGRPTWKPEEVRYLLSLWSGEREVTILDVGNPQCAAVVENFDFDWRTAGAEIEGHGYFPKRTNVSFLRAVGRNAIEARFYERGAGPTLSSGTGSTGAAAAAILRGLAESPVRVIGEAGEMTVRWENAPDGTVSLGGPAEITARGVYFLSDAARGR